MATERNIVYNLEDFRDFSLQPFYRILFGRVRFRYISEQLDTQLSGPFQYHKNLQNIWVRSWFEICLNVSLKLRLTIYLRPLKDYQRITDPYYESAIPNEELVPNE